ncbi:MAG: hypothetical protein ABSG53_17385 [Thermoguttaceae bacterium]|jgi:tetratricopeptide (TPR) repeat protein
MARSFLSLSFALATFVLLGAGATSASAQPAIPTPPASAAPAAPTKQVDSPEVQEALQELIKTGSIPNAISKLEEALRKYPDLPSAHVIMGSWLASPKFNRRDLALLQLDEAVKTNSSDPEPYVILGKIALQDRRLSEAAIDFHKAEQLLATYNTTPKHKATIEHETLSGIARVAEAQENWKEAEPALRDLLKVIPEDLVAHQRLARSLFWQGKAGDAYEILRKAKGIDRANSRRNNTREEFLTPEAIMGKYYDEIEGPTSKNAKIWFDAALSNVPKDLATREVVGIWALRKGNLPYAKEQAEAILKLEESDVMRYRGSNVGHMLRGLAALWEKRWGDAEKDFEPILLPVPNDFGARNNLALALVEQNDPGKKRRALALAETNYRDNINSPDALSTLAWIYFRVNEFDLAWLTIKKDISLVGGRIDPDTKTYLAHILYHQDNKWPAKECLDDVLKADQPFAMRKEAQELYEKVKDTRMPEGTPAAKTP